MRYFRYKDYSFQTNNIEEYLLDLLTSILEEKDFGVKKMNGESGLTFDFKPKYAWHRGTLFYYSLKSLRKGRIQLKRMNGIIGIDYSISHLYRLIINLIIWLSGIVIFLTLTSHSLTAILIFMTVLMSIFFIIGTLRSYSKLDKILNELIEKATVPNTGE